MLALKKKIGMDLHLIFYVFKLFSCLWQTGEPVGGVGGAVEIASLPRPEAGEGYATPINM